MLVPPVHFKCVVHQGRQILDKQIRQQISGQLREAPRREFLQKVARVSWFEMERRGRGEMGS